MFYYELDDKKIEQDILNIVQQTIDKTAQKMAKELSRKLLVRTSSKYYSRTGDLVNALANPPKAYYSGNQIVWSLVDLTKIRQETSKLAHQLNSHMSIDGSTTYNGKSIQYWSLANQETGYTVLKKKRIKGLNFIAGALGTDDIDYYLNKEVNKIVQKYMKQFIIEMKKGVN